MAQVMVRAALVVALLILAAPPQAWGAWLLWSSYQTNKTEHAIQAAFESQRACEDAIAAAVQRHLAAWQGPYERVRVSAVEPTVIIAQGMPDSPRKREEGDTLMIRVGCWPLGLRPTGITGGAEYAR